ncbi:MAG: hypothetical protein JW856_05445 [Dehalococcoidales bacterium]|nr:hypothetical protein [Dehalococcoidales bacterium]
MTDTMNNRQPKKVKKWVMVLLIIGEVLFCLAIMWAMWFYLFRNISSLLGYLFLSLCVVFFLIAGVVIYLSRRWMRRRLQGQEKTEPVEDFINYDEVRIDEEIRKYLRTAKIFYALSSALMFLVLLVVLDISFISREIIPIPVIDADNLNIISIIMAVLAIIFLLVAYRLPRMWLNLYKKMAQKRKPGVGSRLASAIFFVSKIRWGMLIGIFSIGVILSLFGVKWQITLPFLVVPGVLYTLIFPSKKKWKKMAQEIVGSFPKETVKEGDVQ